MIGFVCLVLTRLPFRHFLPLRPELHTVLLPHLHRSDFTTRYVCICCWSSSIYLLAVLYRIHVYIDIFAGIPHRQRSRDIPLRLCDSDSLRKYPSNDALVIEFVLTTLSRRPNSKLSWSDHGVWRSYPVSLGSIDPLLRCSCLVGFRIPPADLQPSQVATKTY